MSKGAWLEHGAVLLLFTILTLALTWPLALYFGQGINVFGDVVLQMTALTWDAHALTTQPLGIFEAPFFYPYAHSNAYSEPLIGETLIALPLFWLTGGDPAPAHNFNFVLSFVLTGYATYLLVRDLTGHRLAAVGAGIAYAFTGYRFVQSGHLNILATQWFPFTLWALRRGLRGNHGGYLALAAFFCVCMGLFSVYFLYFLAILVGLYVAWWLLAGRRPLPTSPAGPASDAPRPAPGGRPGVRLARNAALALLGAAVVLVPFYVPYLQVNQELGLARSVYEVQSWAAQPAFYGNILPTNWLWAHLVPSMISIRGERQLFPGLIITLLAAFGLLRVGSRQYAVGRDESVVSRQSSVVSDDAVGSRQQAVGRDEGAGVGSRGSDNPKSKIQNPKSKIDRPEQWFYLLLLGAGLVLTFGTSIRLPLLDKELPLPYALLYDWVPGFQALRVPVRFAALVNLALAVLGGYGLAALLGTGRRGTAGLGLALLALMTLEYVQIRDLGNHRVMRPPDPQPYTWLASHPGPVVELPMGGSNFSDVWYTYWATYDWQPLVSGAGSFLPPGTVEIAHALATFPDAPSIALLQGLEIRHVVVHLSQYKEANRRALQGRLAGNSALRLVFQQGDAWVYEVAADPWATRLKDALPAGGYLWLGRGSSDRAPALETLAYALKYGRLPDAQLPAAADHVAGDLPLGNRTLPPLPYGRAADLALLPVDDPAGADLGMGAPFYRNRLVALYRRDPALQAHYDLTAPNAPAAPHGLALPEAGTRFTWPAAGAPLQADLLFAAFAPTQITVGPDSVTLAPGLTRYRTGALTGNGLDLRSTGPSGRAGLPALLSVDLRSAAEPAAVGAAAALTDTLLLDLGPSSVDAAGGAITTRWRIVPRHPGGQPFTLSLDVYQKPFGTHPDGHLGSWSLPLPAGAAGRSYTLTLHPVAKTATATLDGAATAVFAWQGPPHGGDFSATLNLLTGPTLLERLPVYDFTLDNGRITEFQPGPGAVVRLPFAGP
ncbi:MAG TPA: hypothetical protein VKY74_17560 [Chloroflexia bacterium]|nr:hypothetical protein [Chloroflexia bacterium]